jgi:hypothetical protein
MIKDFLNTFKKYESPGCNTNRISDTDFLNTFKKYESPGCNTNRISDTDFLNTFIPLVSNIKLIKCNISELCNEFKSCVCLHDEFILTTNINNKRKRNINY